MRRILLATAAAAGALALAGCGAGGLYGGSSGSSSSSAASGGSSTAAPAAASSVLSTWSGPLGTVLADARGHTVYEFDKDTAGSATSACTGTCVGLWPALTTTSSAPTVTGVTGTIGTLPTADGGQQVTINGHRLYTFSGDSGSKQVSGQGFMNLWWVVSPAGQQIKGSATASTSALPGY